MARNIRLVALTFVLGCWSTVAPPAATQPQTPALPEAVTRRTPQFENDSVRVWKSLIVPGQPLSLHRHERGRVIVALKGGTLRVVKETGASHVVAWETGKAYWLPADPPGEMHGDLNEGESPIEVMVVELVAGTP